MIVTYCDVTREEVASATTEYAWKIRDQRYDSVGGCDLSIEGLAKVEEAVRAELAKSDTFDYMEYKRILREKLAEMTA